MNLRLNLGDPMGPAKIRENEDERQNLSKVEMGNKFEGGNYDENVSPVPAPLISLCVDGPT